MSSQIAYEKAEYNFTDADTEEETIISGLQLMVEGLRITIKEKRTAKIYFYQEI